MKSKVFVSLLIILLNSCSNYDQTEEKEKTIEYKYGYNKDQYLFEEKKVGKDDILGYILEDGSENVSTAVFCLPFIFKDHDLFEEAIKECI